MIPKYVTLLYPQPLINTTKHGEQLLHLHPQPLTDQSRTVDIPQEVKDALKKFRFSRHKGTSAISSASLLIAECG